MGVQFFGALEVLRVTSSLVAHLPNDILGDCRQGI